MRALFPLVLLTFTLCALPAQAQQITLSTQVDYLLVDQRFRDPDERKTTSGFLPRLNLSLNGRLLPGSRLYLDVTGGLSRDSFGLGQQSTEDAHVVLRGESPYYQLSLRHGRSHFDTSSVGLDLTPVGLTSDSQETGLTLILRQPAWPVLNLQYARFSSDTGLGDTTSRTDSTLSRVVANYDLAPLRFRFDDNRRTSDAQGGSSYESDARRFGVSVDSAVLPKLNFYGDLQFAHADTSSGGVPRSGENSRIGQVRVSTELTPKVAVDAELHATATNPLIGTTFGALSSRGSAVTMRSEVMPGVQLNFTRNMDHADYRGGAAETSSLYGDLLARVDVRNSLALQYAPTRTSFSGYPPTDQKVLRLSWASQLDSRTDLTASVDRFTDTGAGFENRTDGKYLAVRYRPDLQTTLGLGLFANTSRNRDAGAETSQDTRSLEAEFSWLPTSDLSLGLHLNLSRLSGPTQMHSRVPAFDLRWQPDSQTDLSVSWRLQDEVQRALDSTSRLGFSALSGQFRRQLSRRSSLYVNYDVVTYDQGPLAYERRLGVSVITGLGR
jgi:hypothetical protein